jgi:hypothetical protein
LAAEITIDEAVKFVHQATERDAGRYFANIGPSVQLGVGLIYDGIDYPAFNIENNRYKMQRGIVLVLTHECDIDRGNNKVFNDDILVAPLVPIEPVIARIAANRTSSEVKAYLGDLAAGRISQILYLPPWEQWPNGAVIFLNQITHARYEQFGKPAAHRIVALTGFGYSKLHIHLTNHLLRAKVDTLPLARIPEGRTTGRTWLSYFRSIFS